MSNKLLGLILFMTTTICMAQQTTPPLINKFVGKYVITDIVGYAEISAGVPEAKRVLGKVISISSEMVNFDNERCKPKGGFKVSEVETTPVLKDYYDITTVDAGLSAKALLLDSSNCTPVFLMDEYRIVFGSNGVVVRAIRDDSKLKGVKKRVK